MPHLPLLEMPLPEVACLGLFQLALSGVEGGVGGWLARWWVHLNLYLGIGMELIKQAVEPEGPAHLPSFVT